MNVGEYIKQLRNKNGYSQEQLGRLVGVQRAAVQKWECGKVQNLKRETITKLAGVFNVSPASFFSGDDNEEMMNPLLDELMTVAKKLPSDKVETLIHVAEGML